MFILDYFNRLNKNFLSEKTKIKSERIILNIAIASFALHLAIIFLVDFGIIKVDSSDLLSNPIVAIYTPFSFILLYEVYLLIYYLPKSFTTYISKQYEIITLIVIRRLFKDLSNLKLTSDWFSNKQDLQFTYDLATSILLFFLIYLFYVQSKIRFAPAKQDENHVGAISSFIKIKNQIATFLVPVFLILAIYSLSNWLLNIFLPKEDLINSFKNINNIFFEQFFTILIVTDVLLLLFSFFITDEFHKVIRNSGFIISTILIRISFSISGGLNDLLIISAIIFGLLILVIHNKFERKISNESSKL